MKIPLETADKVGCSREMIKKIRVGVQPSLKLAIAIVEEMGPDAPRLVDMIPLLRKAFHIMIKQGVG